MLLEELSKGGDRNIKGICAIVLFKTRKVCLPIDSAGGLEVADGGRRFSVDVVLQAIKGLDVGIVEKTALLEEEREVCLATGLGVLVVV